MTIREVEPQLYKIDRFIQERKRLVTRKSVYTEVEKTGFRKNEMAHLVAHPNAKRPKEYSVVLKTTFYNRNKNNNIDKLKRISAHELAHIVVPHRHNEQFQRTAKRLGAGRYSNTRQG